MRATRNLTFFCAIAAGLGGWPAPLQAQDMMATCAPEIGQYCSGVSRGRGRILACLISRGDKLGAACNADVRAVARQGSRNPLVPPGVRKMLTSGQAGSIPGACSSDVAKFCSGISHSNERVLACLYSQSGNVSRSCSSQVRTALE